MDHSDHDMGSMTPPPSMNGPMMSQPNMMMHITFFWSTNAEILFNKWPGTNTGMYYLALLFVFALAVIVEWLSHSRLIKCRSSHVTAGMVQTLLHTIRVGLAYLVMLAVMSFNAGVFLVAVAGHALGFLLFRSRVLRKSVEEKVSDLPPMSC